MASCLVLAYFGNLILAVSVTAQFGNWESGSKKHNFMVIHDKDQKSVVKVELKENKEGVHVMSMQNPIFEDVEVLCIDPHTGRQAYKFVEEKVITIGEKRMSFGDKVLHMEYDPCGGQLFWNTESHIYRWKVSTESFYQQIYSVPPRNRTLSIAVDVKRDHIYWTQRNNAIQRGEIWRMRADGSEVTKIFTTNAVLYAITIDHEMDMLYAMSAAGSVLYMMPLELLENAVDDYIPVYIDYETDPYIKSKSMIYDIVAFHGRIYFVHPERGRLLRFSVVLGPSSMEEYGNTTILRSGSMGFYSGSHYDQNMASLQRCKERHSTSDDQSNAVTSTSVTTSPTTQYDNVPMEEASTTSLGVTETPSATFSTLGASAVTDAASGDNQMSKTQKSTDAMTLSTNAAVRSSNSPPKDLTTLTGSTSPNIDPTHPCAKIFERADISKESVSKTFRLCVGFSSLIKSSDES